LIGAITLLALIFALKAQPTEATIEPAPTVAAPVPASNLLDQARLGTWSVPGRAVPPVVSQGYKISKPREVGGFQESDFVYANGKYYLFSTSSQDPAWTDVYVGDTPEALLKGPPAFTHVAPVRYPTVVKDGDTWHIWGVNPTKTAGQKWTEHWTTTNADPTGFVYTDTPFSGPNNPVMVDFAVRKHPTNGNWYGVGFETWFGAPLLLASAPAASGPWTKLNYLPARKEGGIFGDTGAPPWATFSRPDPNIAFTGDGLAWVFFTGKPNRTDLSRAIWRAGIVQVDLATGKATGTAVVLYDPEAHVDLPFQGASDLNLVSVPGQQSSIFAYAASADYPLAVLDLPANATLPAGLTSTDLVRLDMEQGFDPAVGMSPDVMRSPYRWGSNGLDVAGNYGGAAGYLASAYLADLSFKVDFTPRAINAGSLNVVAHIGAAGTVTSTGTGIGVRIDGADANNYITAIITGTDKSVIRLNSRIGALPNTRYSVELKRTGSDITLLVNGFATNATGSSVLTGLEGWSLAAQQPINRPPLFPFQGTIHSFVVTGIGIP
jgi:hypothetical protein